MHTHFLGLSSVEKHPKFKFEQNSCRCKIVFADWQTKKEKQIITLLSATNEYLLLLVVLQTMYIQLFLYQYEFYIVYIGKQ